MQKQVKAYTSQFSRIESESLLWSAVRKQTSFDVRGLSTSTFRNVVMIPLKSNGIMTIFRKVEVDSPTYKTVASQGKEKSARE